ncbi:uncharacterized protein LOC110849558 isoform X2 [Folsomia candida]|uniref:uncharacterized protein LOC110849558 isoform X2 n=1 Tax=Folsomia candida TaxID=158441 RepID=UPI001604F15A|nr:uncharacterized protein LOC110849558 isoform X2 [Folsomia candida]
MTTEMRGSETTSSSWTYTWEDYDFCQQEPLRDEERILLNTLQTIGAQYNPQSPPPLWENEGFTYDPKNPEDSAFYHYCLVEDNQFVFCADPSECKCDKTQLYYNLRISAIFTEKMLKNSMGADVDPSEVQLQQQAVAFLAKHLRNNCDKIFNRSIPFVIDAHILRRLCDAIGSIYTSEGESKEEDPESDLSIYQDLVLFLSDFCQQTPSLCINVPKPKPKPPKVDIHNLSVAASSSSDIDSSYGGSDSASTSTSTPTSSKLKKSTGAEATKKVGDAASTEMVDISMFKSLQLLELRNTPPHRISGLSSLRMNLQKIKCSRNLKSIGQVLKPPSNTNIAQIWPELRDLDLSYNKIPSVFTEEIAVLELCPSLDNLNLSHNRIIGIDDSFSRILNSLSTLNLCFNQLTCIPPIPPNVKILLLSHNLIVNLISPKNRVIHSDPFNLLCSLKNVEVLDLSTNLISNETDLVPLKEMNSLNKLNMTGNPISFNSGYRRSVGGYLNRYVINRKFELDKKNLSSSEVREAIEDSKQGKFIPYVPASSLAISQANSAMSASLSSGVSGSMSTSNSMQRSGNSISQLKSMTQSFDSTSSSMQSLRRKKPKIREIMSIDFQEDRENSYSESTSSAKSGSSFESKKDNNAETTRKALKALRDKYGPEHWLLRQAGTEVDRLLRIPGRPINYDLFSRSLPHNSRDFGQSSSFNNSFSPPTSSLYYERAVAQQERYTNEELLLINSRKARVPSEDKTPVASPPGLVPGALKTGEEDNTPDFFSYFSADVGEDVSIFDLSKDEPIDDIFVEEGKKDVKIFKTFQNGEIFKLIVWDGYLMDVNMEDNVILNKWDLHCLFALEEEKCDAETESVQFMLKFDTMRKSMRERSFIMSSKEFAVFDKVVSPFIEQMTLQEFTEALQCAKCFAQFSKAMAGRTVKHEPGTAPREVRICPNPQCANDILLTLDNIPLPNNECLDLDLEEDRLRGPLKASTPVSDTKSESDIEVLSTDSSSIEVLGKHGPDSGSEVDTEEAIEVPVVDSTKLGNIVVPLSESTSSSSCADSIVTTYEKNNLLPISQPLNSPSKMPSGASSLCTNASYASTSTLTTNSYSSPVHNTCMPVRYDYVNFGKTDHRLQLWSDVSIFKSDETLLALTKCMIISNSSSHKNFLGIVIFSTKKVYLYRITGNEGDRPQEWLQKVTSFDLAKFTKLDVLIGRHGVGVDFSGKYYALIFRDSERTSGFLEFFMSDICGTLKSPPMVRDFSQTQKMMLSATNPISYFGIMRYAVCDSPDNTYSVSAVLLTNEEVLLITDLSWMAGRSEKVTTTHGRKLSHLRQVESLESDATFLRLAFTLEQDRIVNWELIFETENERSRFKECLKSDLNRDDVPFICLSQPLDS